MVAKCASTLPICPTGRTYFRFKGTCTILQACWHARCCSFPKGPLLCNMHHKGGQRGIIHIKQRGQHRTRGRLGVYRKRIFRKRMGAKSLGGSASRHGGSPLLSFASVVPGETTSLFVCPLRWFCSGYYTRFFRLCAQLANNERIVRACIDRCGRALWTFDRCPATSLSTCVEFLRTTMLDEDTRGYIEARPSGRCLSTIIRSLL